MYSPGSFALSPTVVAGYILIGVNTEYGRVEINGCSTSFYVSNVINAVKSKLIYSNTQNKPNTLTEPKLSYTFALLNKKIIYHIAPGNPPPK